MGQVDRRDEEARIQPGPPLRAASITPPRPMAPRRVGQPIAELLLDRREVGPNERVHPEVQQLVGLQHAERAQRMAIERARSGDVAGARDILNRVAGRIAEYAGDDPALLQAVEGLRQAAMEFDRRGYAPAMAKEAYSASQTRSRGQRDLRGKQE